LICEGVADQNLTEQKEARKKTLTDLILRKKAEIAILSIPEVEGHHLQVETHDCVTTLSGHVHSEEERAEVRQAARGIEGTRDVIDQLKVIEYRTYPKDD